MEGRMSVGMLVGVMLSIPLWLSMIGWLWLAQSLLSSASKLIYP
ncbi:hypothetical protein [Paenibacillus sp. YYML68]|nr:hypothetical protein [Paenibacillus sp. YYML68]